MNKICKKMLLNNSFIEFVAEHCVLHLLRRLSYTMLLRKNIVNNKFLDLYTYGARSAPLRKKKYFFYKYKMLFHNITNKKCTSIIILMHFHLTLQY